MGMPVEPVYDQTDFRARTAVPDPSGIDAAFDGSDVAVNTDWDQLIDELIRVRFVVKQTEALAINSSDLTTAFLLQYENVTDVSGWVTVGAVGGDVEDVQYIAATGFANHDNTAGLLGAGTNIAGDGLEAAGATDDIAFSEETAGEETELEFSIEIVGSLVTNGDLINLRLLYSVSDAAPPATTFTANSPQMTVDAGAIDETGRSTTVLVVTSSTDTLDFNEGGASTTVLVVTSSTDALIFNEGGRATTVLVVTSSTDSRAENDLGLSTTVLVVTSSTDTLVFNEGGASTTVLVVTTSSDDALLVESGLSTTVLVVTSSTDAALFDETATTTVTVLVVTSSTDTRAENELGLNTTVLVVTSSTDTLDFNEGGRATTVLVVTSSTDAALLNEGGRSTTVLVVTSSTDVLVFGEGGRSTTVLVVTSSTDVLVFGEGGRSTTVLVVTSSTDTLDFDEGGRATTVLVVTSSTDVLVFNEPTAAVVVLVIVTGTDSEFMIFDETGRLTIVLVIVTSTDSGGTIVSGPPGSGVGVAIAAQLRAVGADTGLGQRERIAHILLTLVAVDPVDRRQQGFEHSLSRTLAILTGEPLLAAGADADRSIDALHEFMLITRERRQPVTGQLIDVIEAL